MAGTDSTQCSVCGEGFYDKPDRVGGVCPDCWNIQKLEQAAADAQIKAEEAIAVLEARRSERQKTLDEREAAKRPVTPLPDRTARSRGAEVPKASGLPV